MTSKKVLLFSLLLVFSSVNIMKAQDEIFIQDRPFLGLKGEIKSFIEKNYILSGSATSINVDDSLNVATYTFNPQGALIKIEKTDPFGIQVSLLTNSKLDSLIPLESRLVKVYFDKRVIENSHLERDPSYGERWITQTENSSDTTYIKRASNEITFLKDDRGEELRTEIVYSKFHKAPGIIKSYRNKKLTDRIDSKFDANGLEIEQIHSYKYSQQPNIVYSYIYKTDTAGNWVERITFINKEPLSRDIRIFSYKEKPSKEFIIIKDSSNIEERHLPKINTRRRIVPQEEDPTKEEELINAVEFTPNQSEGAEKNKNTSTRRRIDASEKDSEKAENLFDSKQFKIKTDFTESKKTDTKETTRRRIVLPKDEQ